MGEPSQGSETTPGWLKTNQGVATILIVFFVSLIVYIGFQDWVYQKLRDGFYLGTFTVVSAVAMLLCALAMIVGRHKNEIEDEMAPVGTLDLIVALVVAVAAYSYFLIAWRVDFLLITPVFLFVAMYVLGVRPIKTALIAGVTTTVVIFGLFFLLGIRLPSFLTP